VTEPGSQQECLWRTTDHSRQFIVPASVSPPSGALTIRSLIGDEISADETWLRRFEVSVAEARAGAKVELGDALDEVKGEVDTKLAAARARLDALRHAPVDEDTDVTADAVPALLAFVGKLPRAILDSLSGDENQIAKARESLAKIQQRLSAAGIDVGDKLEGFPERLAGLRDDYDRERNSRQD
jgi:hypothetical protein